MSSSATQTQTQTYTVADVEKVIRRFTTDLRMIAESSGAITRSEAEDYGYDVEYLAKKGYLKFVDVTLLVNGAEQKAVRYTVNTQAGDLAADRPGGVLWPALSGAHLRVIVGPTEAFWLKASVVSALRISWVPTSQDVSHSSLGEKDGRTFVSSAYGIVRKDYSK
jgi:hypothetical protein